MAAPTYDSSGVASGGGGTTSLSYSHTVTGSNPALFTGVGFGADAGSSATATYNGASLTQKGATTGYTYYFNNIYADAGIATGAHTLACSITGNPSIYNAVLIGVSVADVDQSSSFGTVANANNTTGQPSVTLTTAVDDFCLVLAYGDCSGAPSAGSGLTLRQEAHGLGGYGAAVATRTATGTSETMDFTGFNGANWLAQAIGFKPVAAASRQSLSLLGVGMVRLAALTRLSEPLKRRGFFKSLAALFVKAAVALAIWAIPVQSEAGTVTLPWSTTLDCAEVAQNPVGGDWTPNCDGLSRYGTWCANSDCTNGGAGIKTAANNASGGGGRGLRFRDYDGSNSGSGGVVIDFTAVDEIYIRWYMRYQSGYAWNPLSYDKTFYMNGNTIPEMHGSDNWNFFNGSNHDIAGAGFQTMNGGSTGDGQYHCYEIHMKRNGGTNDDTGEVWLDGVNKGSVTGFDYTASFGEIIINENQCCPNNGAIVSLDYDDIAVQTTGPIGCLGGGGGSPTGGSMDVKKQSEPITMTRR